MLVKNEIHAKNLLLVLVRPRVVDTANAQLSREFSFRILVLFRNVFLCLIKKTHLINF